MRKQIRKQFEHMEVDTLSSWASKLGVPGRVSPHNMGMYTRSEALQILKLDAVGANKLSETL